MKGKVHRMGIFISNMQKKKTNNPQHVLFYVMATQSLGGIIHHCQTLLPQLPVMNLSVTKSMLHVRLFTMYSILGSM